MIIRFLVLKIKKINVQPYNFPEEIEWNRVLQPWLAFNASDAFKSQLLV